MSVVSRRSFAESHVRTGRYINFRPDNDEEMKAVSTSCPPEMEAPRSRPKVIDLDIIVDEFFLSRAGPANSD